VEVVRGPQGLLYGSSGAGGTINTTSKRANFNRRNGTASWRIDQYGSKQGQLDYNHGGGRELFSAPDSWQINAIFSYRRKLGRRFGWVTQVNVENIFNHYVLSTLPNNGSGFTNPANLGVTFSGQPRMYVWTNSLSF
jgi:outer membrane receptor protein involved in Fe transport